MVDSSCVGKVGMNPECTTRITREGFRDRSRPKFGPSCLTAGRPRAAPTWLGPWRSNLGASSFCCSHTRWPMDVNFEWVDGQTYGGGGLGPPWRGVRQCHSTCATFDASDLFDTEEIVERCCETSPC